LKIRDINKILVANRGEIAIRIYRACIELGIRTVGIFSYEDRMSLHRYKADESYQVGAGNDPVKAYLDIDGIINIAKECGADAIHPGYGLLSENPDFAKACSVAGITFIGPDAEIVRDMGDKVAARAFAKRSGVPYIPGTEDALQSFEEARDWCDKHGYPSIIKASFGGGGRGMRVVRSSEDLEDSYNQAKHEAETAFGQDSVFLERFLENAKHIEVQVLADHYGNVVHLFERDCSIQRRHQKVVEIAPCITISEEKRKEICDYAVLIAKEIGYKNAGTVEFLVDNDWNIYFIEMNTRIQVEHTITEMITGIDLVKNQIRIAQGYSLAELELLQESITIKGYAIQCRLTTEDPQNNFTPDHGRIDFYQSPAGFGIRLDAGSAYDGAMITPFYDSMLVKVTAWSLSFSDTISKMQRALHEFRVRGVKTNIVFLESLLGHEIFANGECRTLFIDTHPELFNIKPRVDQLSHILEYIGEVNVNGNPIVKNPDKSRVFREIVVPKPEENAKKGGSEGSRDIFNRLGAEKFSKWIMDEKRLLITDTTFRDAHQSLLATRVRTYDMLRVAEQYGIDNPDVFSLEMWGGATFDVSMRFLRECPWERLATLREKVPHILFQMLLRASNAVGYTAYPDNVVREFIRLSARTGMDIFRIFDSLNWDENMKIAIETVRDEGKIAEVAICYTGDILDPTKTKYTLNYYVKLAKRLENMGASILAIKDMAGLCRPYAAHKLVSTLKNEIGIPIHLHTHDTAGVQAATILKASEAGVDIADCAISSMSGLTSQANLNSIVAALKNTPRDTGLDLKALNKYSDYWECVREMYYPFESGLMASTAEVYDHEIPGGQYSNLWPQAQSMGLGERWVELKKMYASVNILMGNIVKVTPSSKVVGDMALYLMTNNVKADEVLDRIGEIDFPESVIGFFKGNLGIPHGGFPEELQKAVLKGREHIDGRPGESMPSVDFVEVRKEVEEKVGHDVEECDVLSYILYPKVFSEFDEYKKNYGDLSIIPTDIFLYGIKVGREVFLELQEGNGVTIKLLGRSGVHENGMRDLFFEVNGEPRNIKVFDKNSGVEVIENVKADSDNPCHVASPMPGMIVDVCVNVGDNIEKGDKVFIIEAMKMVTNVYANIDGQVAHIEVKKGTEIGTGDLLMAFV